MSYSIYVIRSGGTVDQDYGNLAWGRIDDAKQRTLIAKLIEQKDEIFLDEKGDIVEETDDHECSISIIFKYHYKTKQEAAAFRHGFSIALTEDDDDLKREELFIHEVFKFDEVSASYC
jgi:hypothetical protein